MGNEQTRELSVEERKLREIAEMDWEVKQKLAMKGPKFNMKVVIKGERNTGKTCLWKRLQGLPFEEAYVPTPEIQVCNINWAYKASDEIVKNCNKKTAKRKKREGTLKLREDEDEDVLSSPEVLADLQKKVSSGGSYTLELDASVIDIYKGTHAVILTMDPTKKWTFEYAKREIEKIPSEIPTALVVNYRDMASHRLISEKEIKEWVELQGRPYLRSFEASMLNNFGLKTVATFFNIPFLKLQRNYIEQQLLKNESELVAVEEEFKILSNDLNYDTYIKGYEESKKNKKTVKSGLTNSAPFSDSPTPSRSAPTKAALPAKESPPPQKLTSNLQQQQPPPPPSIVEKPLQKSSERPPEKVATPPPPQRASVPPPTRVTTPPPVEPPKEEAPKRSFFGRMVSKVKTQPSSTNLTSTTGESSVVVESDLKKLAATKKESTDNIDDFEVPMEDEFFGKDENSAGFGGMIGGEDDDDEKPNPMLMKDEDLDGSSSSEEEPPKPVIKKEEPKVIPKQQQVDSSKQQTNIPKQLDLPKQQSPPPTNRNQYASLDAESEEEEEDDVEEIQTPPPPTKKPEPIKPVQNVVPTSLSPPSSSSKSTVPTKEPAKPSSITVPVPKYQPRQTQQKTKTKKKKSTLAEDNDSSDEGPSTYVIPMEGEDDSDDDLFSTIGNKKYGDDDDDDDDPFNPKEVNDADFERILKPIKPYPKPTASIKIGNQNAITTTTNQLSEEKPKNEERSKKGRRKPPVDETPEQRAARKKRNAMRKARKGVDDKKV